MLNIEFEAPLYLCTYVEVVHFTCLLHTLYVKTNVSIDSEKLRQNGNALFVYFLLMASRGRCLCFALFF